MKRTSEDTKMKKFDIGSTLVYPTHGVGKVTGVEETTIAGTKLELYVLSFEDDNMTLKVPTSKAAQIGLRELSQEDEIDEAIKVLSGKPKIGRGMWSRRATEYNTKINSGDVNLISEVVRDLHKNVDDPDRSYSERIIYESAFKRLSSEYCAVKKISYQDTEEFLISNIRKSKKKVAEEETEESAVA